MSFLVDGNSFLTRVLDIFILSKLMESFRRYSEVGVLKISRYFFLSLFCLSNIGCLASDPESISSIKFEEESQTGLVIHKTRAPLKIDPEILANRSFSEAPVLAKRVELGRLPRISDRLPERPLVMVPLEEIGTYGGTLRRALTADIVQVWGVGKTLDENLMIYERPRPNSIQLSLAESYEYRDEGKIAVFKIRKGVKWSDGHPFTVDDILFWYYDMELDDNARNLPTPSPVWMVDGKPISFEKVDDYTLKVSSTKPLGRILQAFCASEFARPKHFFSRYHPRYNPESTYEAFKDSTTDALLRMRPGTPSISAWVPVGWVRGQRLIYERNPYYWKIDTAGNQLPYADKLIFSVIRDGQVILLKFINGEVDIYGRNARVSMYTTLKAQERNGKYKLRLSETGSGPAFYLNWSCPKPQLQEAFRNKKVRIALSHAINREEINQILFFGLLVPAGYSYSPMNPYYSKEDHQKYATFDPEKSRLLLDEAGYVDQDGDGYREFKDGSPFELTIDVAGTGPSKDVCEIVKSHWEAVELKVHINVGLRDIIWPRRMNGDFDIHFWGLEAPEDPLVRPNDWAAMGPGVPFWHRSASIDGPDWFKEATRLMKLAMTTVDSAKLRNLMVKARELHSDNVPVIATGYAYGVWGYNSRLGNVPQNLYSGDVFRGHSQPVMHEQIYIKDFTRGSVIPQDSIEKRRKQNGRDG